MHFLIHHHLLCTNARYTISVNRQLWGVGFSISLHVHPLCSLAAAISAHVWFRLEVFPGRHVQFYITPVTQCGFEGYGSCLGGQHTLFRRNLSSLGVRLWEPDVGILRPGVFVTQSDDWSR